MSWDQSGGVDVFQHERAYPGTVHCRHSGLHYKYEPVGARMRHMSRSAIGPPVSVNRYLLPNEHSVITVRMHPAALAESLIMVCGGLVAARKLTSRSARQDLVWGAYLLLPLHFLHRLAAWPVTYLTVTDERMMLIHGSFSRTVAAM